MGWWRADKEGGSLYLEETGLVWGDSVADVMGVALKDIFEKFEEYWHRKPTEDELKGGLMFSARPLLEEESDS